MKKIRDGKTKAVFEVDDGNILLQFKDDVTGVGDVVDPGANSVIGQIEGKGNASLKLTKHFFEILKENDIPTHYIQADTKKNTMLVKRAETFGDGLEFICRLKVTGSFVKRYGKYAREDQSLDYLVEITLKDDQRQDPLINDDSLVQLNLLSKEEVDEAKALTRKITELVKEECERFNLELIDIKLEFGRVEGKIVVIDEISGDNMRVRKKGKTVMQRELCDIICG